MILFYFNASNSCLQKKIVPFDQVNPLYAAIVK